MVIAAAAAKQAAFGIADDCRLIEASPRAAGRGGRGVFYSRPGLELGDEFSGVFRKIKTCARTTFWRDLRAGSIVARQAVRWTAANCCLECRGGFEGTIFCSEIRTA